jgi:hypothetical protein
MNCHFLTVSFTQTNADNIERRPKVYFLILICSVQEEEEEEEVSVCLSS